MEAIFQAETEKKHFGRITTLLPKREGFLRISFLCFTIFASLFITKSKSKILKQEVCTSSSIVTVNFDRKRLGIYIIYNLI